jgi:hypothetical protein
MRDSNLMHETVNRVISGLRSIGYQGTLLEENYKFPDWFSPAADEWSVAAAAFGQTPISYDSACIGVVCSNGLHGPQLVNKCRALGAPVLLEIGSNQITEWMVSRTEDNHGFVESYPFERIPEMFAMRAADWRPQSILRAKNIGSYKWNQQLALFVGLLPDLEHHIQGKLDPLLREMLSETRRVYRESTGREPNPKHLFQLIFWILTAKVFYDRQVPSFANLSGDVDDLLAAVARHYRTEVPRLLTREARQSAANRIWHEFDFRNLSVEVLIQIWSQTLVDEETKEELSIHRTSRTIVRYILDRIPLAPPGDERLIILEPCSGSAVFLMGAMNMLRHNLFGADASERHQYFVEHLVGIEKDPFAVEISKSALTLADFPNPNGWKVVNGDVFDPSVSSAYLKRAGVVLCNPPYSDFGEDERTLYDGKFVQKPAALLNRVLNDLHPQGVLGFVLPRRFIDGGAYADARRRLAERFATLELTVLPDRAFEADSEVVLLVATDPIPHAGCRVTNRRVDDNANAWANFESAHEVSSESVAEFSMDEAEESFLVPELSDFWGFLVNYPQLREFAELHRGIQWNKPLTKHGGETGNRQLLIRNQPEKGYKLGVAPRTSFSVFEKPSLAYLNMLPEDQLLGAWKYQWEKPKAILNKAARSRGRWRMAAFPDTEGITCYQTYIGVWPTSSQFDEWLLSAILNSPVANAFVATREGKTDITFATLELIPMPHFTESQRNKLRKLIEKYQAITSAIMRNMSDEAERVLKEIDATVLSGYRMPPRIERQLLDFFRDQDRPIKHSFSEYFPKDFSVYFSLSDYLSANFVSATLGDLRKRMRETPHA